MKKIWFFATLFILLPAVCHGGQYALVMSKNDCLCQHMLKLYNADIEKYGKVKYKHHTEFNWIKWEHKKISIVGAEGVTQSLNAKIAFFDINNDSKNEAIVYQESYLDNASMDVYDVFDHNDIAILNETVDGRVYYKKRLKSFSSSESVPVNISALSDPKVLKKLPPEELRYIQAAKKEEKNTYF